MPTPSLRTVLLAVVPLIVSMGILVLGNTLFGTLVSLRLDLDGVSIDHIGLIMALYSVGFVAGTLLCPRVVGAVGHIRAFAAFAAIVSAASLAHALWVDEFLWGALRMLAGFCVAFLFTIVESWLNAKAPNEVRGQVMSAYMVVYYLASGSSQSFLSFVDPAGFQLFAVIAMVISLSLVPLTLARVDTPPQIQTDRLSLRALMRISPLGVAGCFGAGLIVGSFYAMAPVYARGVDASPDWVARFMMVAILAGFALQFPVGRLSDRFDRRSVILGLTVATSATGLAIAVFGGLSVWALLILVALYSGLSLTLYPISLSHANDYLTPSQLVPASAGLLLCYGVGAIIGPIAASWAMGRSGTDGLFYYIAFVSALLALFTLWRMTRRQSLPNDEQGAFVAVPQTTYVVAELDPRYEPDNDDQLSFDFEAGDEVKETA
ncbi:MAG TPA: MFS transporter [Alphaproteobacteria bacterium]|nr:MFS transporter [Alphaproteobacteria bacterium]